eukprot:gene8930-biopygen6072
MLQPVMSSAPCIFCKVCRISLGAWAGWGIGLMKGENRIPYCKRSVNAWRRWKRCWDKCRPNRLLFGPSCCALAFQLSELLLLHSLKSEGALEHLQGNAYSEKRIFRERHTQSKADSEKGVLRKRER